MSDRRKIVNDLIKSIEAPLKAIEIVETELASLKEKVATEQSTYSALKSENEKLRELPRLELERIKKEQADLDKSKQELQDIRAKFLEEESTISARIDSAKSSLEIINNQINAASEDLKKIEPLIAVKLNLEEEIKNLNREITIKADRLKADESEALINLESAKKLLKDTEDNAEKINKDLESKIEFIKSKSNELTLLETKLKNKEEGLAIIERRWKQLYADKGLTFKV